MKKLAILGLLAVCGAAQAVVLYEQAPHVPGAANNNGLSAFGGVLGTSTYDREIADDFNVTGPGWNIDRISASFVQATPGDPNAVTAMEWAVYLSTGSGVGALVTSGTSTSVTRSTGPGTYFGRPEQVLAMDVSITLGAGSYFLMIQPQVDHNWFWLTHSSPNVNGLSAHLRRGPNTGAGIDTGWPVDWTSTASAIFNTAYDQSFKIEGTEVPEPATLAVLGLGVAALARRRRNK